MKTVSDVKTNIVNNHDDDDDKRGKSFRIFRGCVLEGSTAQQVCVEPSYNQSENGPKRDRTVEQHVEGFHGRSESHVP